MAIALRNRLQRELGLDIPTTVMWTHPTPHALTRYLLARLHPEEEQAGTEPTATA